jgi:hypothetical protein
MLHLDGHRLVQFLSPVVLDAIRNACFACASTPCTPSLHALNTVAHLGLRIYSRHVPSQVGMYVSAGCMTVPHLLQLE